MPVTKSVAELGRQPNPAYKKRYIPKTRKHGGFKKSKLGKYNNRGFRLDGRFFHSEAEANRYAQLKVLEATGKITRLECQVPYQIHIDGMLICTYNADFRYFVDDGVTRAILIEDVKGLRTKEYQLKKKLVEARHKIRISELPAQWMNHYDGLTAEECKPTIDRLTAEKKARAAARKARRAAEAQARADAKRDMAEAQG